ncbi:hypothetical protein JAO29_14820 [Edaphobacter sp. HDX4]|uniref:hypothetical protein n=1 Tax=Edaphobacter sp. HDX4 TaxID=2794064 RepID=UPI002FE6C409
MNRISIITVSALLLAIPGSTVYAANLTKDQSAKRAKSTLQQISGQIERISETAGRMSIQSREPSYAEVQGVELNHLSAEINRVGRELKGLESETELLPPWQTEAISRVVPSMHKIATMTTDATELFNKSQSQLFASHYSTEASQIASRAKETATLLGNDLKLEKTRAKEEHLEDAVNGGRSATQGQ